MASYAKLSIASLLPVFVSMILFICEKRKFAAKIHPAVRQILYGIIFGSLAILGTEWGIPLNGAQVNCRDAAVLCAGLLFGSPAGIIAGLIGGIERYVAVAWGIGTFTQIACSVSTIIAGFYSAWLRKYMFENKKPSWAMALAVGIVMEIFHLTMVFITNMGTPVKAMNVVKVCSVPMVLANGISVMLATVAVYLLSQERKLKKKEDVRISQTVQRWLLVAVVVAFVLTSFFVLQLQNQMAETQAQDSLSLAGEDVSNEISDTLDKELLESAYKVRDMLNNYSLDEISQKEDIVEISIVDKNGIITKSTNSDFVGFDMKSGEQSAEFMCLLKDKTEYVQEFTSITYSSRIMRKYAGVRLDNGFLQIGYGESRFKSAVAKTASDITKNRHVGQTGYIIIFDKAFNAVSAPKDVDTDKVKKDISSFNPEKDTDVFSAEIQKEDYLCKFSSVEGHYIFAAIPKTEAYQFRNIAMYVNTYMEILVFALLFAIIYFIVKRVVVNQIKQVNGSLAKITEGDLNEIVNVRTNKEFISLSEGINSTVSTLKKYIAEASARIDKELEFAKNIQSSALPSTFPAFPKRKELDIFASMHTAKEVGGDFYDFYFTHTNIFNFLVADVSGKGIPAAMFMMRAKTELKSLTENDIPLNEVFTRGNDALCEGNDAGMFVTAWQGTIDLNTGLLQYANAGHNPPLIKRKDGKFEYIKSPAGFVLAGMEGVKYKMQTVELKPGDRVYLYTDGVTEATDANNELYGEDRLLNALNAKEFYSMEELCKYVKADVDAFVGDAPQFDDITMLGFEFVGEESAPHIAFEHASIADIPAVTEFIEGELEKLECPMKSVIQINVAVDEIYSNIAKFAYRESGSGPAKVTLKSFENPRRVHIIFEDNGTPYNPLTKEDPDTTLSAEERDIGGLGIFMVKKTMDDMKYKYENNTNILTIVKNI